MKIFDVKIKICEIKIVIQFWRVISKNLWESSSLEGICLYIIFESIGSEIQSSCRVCLIPSLALTPSIKHLHLSTWFARVNDTLWITRITIAGFDSVWFSARGVYIVVCELLMRRVSKIVWTDARRTNFFFFLEIRTYGNLWFKHSRNFWRLGNFLLGSNINTRILIF